MNSPAIKYEVDKDSGAIFVDRMLKTAMYRAAQARAVSQSHQIELIEKVQALLQAKSVAQLVAWS